MKKLLVLAGALLCALPLMAQNIENQVVVSQFGQWSLKGNQSLASGANTIVNFNACLQSAGLMPNGLSTGHIDIGPLQSQAAGGGGSYGSTY